MDNLICARIKFYPVYPLSNRKQKSTLFSALNPRFMRGVFIRPTGVMRSPSSFSSVAASVQPLEASRVEHFDNTLPSKGILEFWRNANAVCFDVDSTVCLDEGIDELAEFCGAGKAVADWTARLSPAIDALVRKLKDKNKDVYLISGGFRQMINPVASILGIPIESIYANQLLFGSSGEFLGFDANEPTSKSGGKATAVENIRKAQGYSSLVMIGDGATDLEARKPGGADLFICYGGVQLREAVAAKADWLVFNFKDLINSLD